MKEEIKPKMRAELNYLFKIRDDVIWRHDEDEQHYESIREQFLENWTQQYLGKLSN